MLTNDSSKNKTVETTDSVADFIDKINDEPKRQDSHKLLAIMAVETGFAPRMWGSNIIGFGSYHYHYDSGREGDAPLVGFSPRKNEFSLYLAYDFDGRTEMLRNFGKHKSGKACIYVKKLADIDEDVLRKLIRASVAWTRKKYPN